MEHATPGRTTESRAHPAAADVLARARALGVVLLPNGATLRIGARAGALPEDLRAAIRSHKRELLELLAHERGASPVQDDRAWRAEFLVHMARAHGYCEDVVREALEVLARQPPGCRLYVGKEIISFEMGDDLEVRLHRLPQAWTATARSAVD